MQMLQKFLPMSKSLVRISSNDMEQHIFLCSSIVYFLEEKGSKQDMREVQNRALMQILQLVLANAVGNTSKNEEIHRVRCDACGTKPIETDRYKCLNCGDIDLCGPCFERRRESAEHKSGHLFAHFKSPGELFGQTVKDEDVTLSKLKRAYGNDIHESISCDGCRAESIKGLRFKCDSCPNYDLCERCAENGVTTKNHDTSHSLILIPRRAIQQIPVEDIELGKELGSGAFGTYNPLIIYNLDVYFFFDFSFRFCVQRSVDIKEPSCCM